jgi:beta-lactamase superfamily II metal-dependent hydrolase
MRRLNLVFVLLVLLSIACGSSIPALPTIDVAQAAQQTLAAAPTRLPTPVPTDTPLVTTDTAVIQPTAVLQLTENVALQPTVVLSNLRVSFVDVGQGDATLLLAPDGKTVLIDGGETDTGIVQYLQSIGVNHIDLMIASHPHSDHIGGLVQVLQAMPVSTVVTNGQMNNTSIYERFLDAIASSKAQYVEVKRGDKLALGSLTFNVLSPVTNTGEDLSNNSIVLRLVYGDVAFLFMGDAQKEAEASILASGLPVQAQILKVGRHGSKTASSPAFLAQVRPEIAIYFAGLGNSYGYPHSVTLSSLGAVGALVYGTDIHGTITVTTDGSGYAVETTKQGQPPIIIQATQPPAPKTLTLDIVSVTSPVAPGAKATLVAQTASWAKCTITVYSKSGPSEAEGLGPKEADANGRVASGGLR